LSWKWLEEQEQNQRNDEALVQNNQQWNCLMATGTTL
jgi:hypothetical protein